MTLLAPCAAAGCARSGPAAAFRATGGQTVAGAGDHGKTNGSGEYMEFGLAFKPPPGFGYVSYGPAGLYLASRPAGGHGDDRPAGLYVQPVYNADWSVRRWDRITRWDADLVDPEKKIGPVEWHDFQDNRSGLRVRQTNVFSRRTEVGNQADGHGWAAVVSNADGGAVSFFLSVAEGTDAAPYVGRAREMLTSIRPAVAS
jgi:hypothetical protein